MSNSSELTTDSFETTGTVNVNNDLVKALNNSDDHFRVLMDLLPICFMAFRGGLIIYINPGLLKLLGYENFGELIGKPASFFFTPESQEHIKKRMKRIAEERVLTNPPIELLLVKKDGEIVKVEAESIVTIHHGAPATMVIIRDITLRKEAEEKLRKSENNLKLIIEQMPDGVLIDTPEKILFVNKSLIQMLGYDNESELIGRSPYELIHPDYHSIVKGRIKRIFSKGGLNPLLEYVWVKKNGQILDVEGSSISIIYEGLPAMIVVVRDITFRKTNQETLKKSEENLKAILHEMPEGVWIVDRDNVLFTNRTLAHLLGYKFESELIERKKFDFIHSDFHNTIRERVDGILGKGGSNPLLKLKLIRKDGEMLEVESSSISIRFNGKPAVMGVLRDITQKNQDEQKAALQEKLASVGTLAAGIAHEINNPLTYVLGNLVFLKENFEEFKQQMDHKDCMDERGRKLFKEIEAELADTSQGGERIRDIVKGLKSFVRTPGDSLAEIDLNQTVESAINMTFHELKHTARVEREFATGLPPLTTNPGKLHQVFTNLLINAGQAMEGRHPERNKIRVRTGLDKGVLFVEITDTGRGIAENILPIIFDPFFTTKPVGVGTGLGLSICAEIVRSFKGTIAVQSQSGKGSVFTVRLPLENGLKAPRIDFHLPPAHFRGRILVVDDEPGNLEVLNRVLKKNADVLTALSGMDALGIIGREQNHIDAIVSDFNMPDMNGEALYKILAQKYPGLEKRMIFITGGLFTEEARNFLAAIPNPCLQKPFKFEDLIKAVSLWTEHSPKTGLSV